MKELSKEEMIQRLMDAGFSGEEAETEYRKMMDEAAEEDGYDGP